MSNTGPSDVSAAVFRNEQHSLKTHQLLEVGMSTLITAVLRIEAALTTLTEKVDTMANESRADFEALLAQLPAAVQTLASAFQSALNNAVAGQDYSADANIVNQALAGLHSLGQLAANPSTSTPPPAINNSPATPSANDGTILPTSSSTTSGAPQITTSSTVSDSTSSSTSSTGV